MLDVCDLSRREGAIKTVIRIPPGPGEERLLCLGPLRHVSTLLVDLYYTLR